MINQDKAPWTPATLKLLGKMPDSAVAKRVGCCTQAVQQRRVRLGIKPFNYKPYNTADGLKDAISEKRVSEMSGDEYDKIAKRLTKRVNHRQGKKA